MIRIRPQITTAIVLSLIAILGCTTTLVGCSNSVSTTSSSTSTSTKSQEKVIIEQINWSTGSAIIDQNRRYVFNCTNNSNYQIAELSMSWTIKSNVTTEKFMDTFSRILDELPEKDKEEITDSKVKKLTLSTDTPYVLNPGDSSNNNKITVGYVYLESESEYNLFEPDIMTIKYVDNNKIITEYYDFKSGSYSTETKTKEIPIWPDNNWTKLIPEPNDMLIIEIDDDFDEFEFKAIGVTPSLANDYIKECKAMGFTDTSVDADFRLLANSIDGQYKIDVYHYAALDNKLTVTISKL